MDNVLQGENSIAPAYLILLAEDDVDFCRLYIRILTGSGYCVDAAKNGEVAWDALQIKNYHLLITDNDMPKMSGIELVKKLRAAGMTLPVIMVSGAMPTEQSNEHSWLQISALLHKPHGIVELLKTVKEVLDA
jgi:DNA-binding response OmpR family regulator